MTMSAMGPDTEIDLSELHQAIIDRIAAQFPDVQTVTDYREEDRTRMPLPAILVELTDFEAVPDQDPGTGQLAMLARWEARIIIGWRTAAAQREVRKLAAALGAFAHLNRWGKPVEAAEVLTMTPDAFDPALDQFVVWRVEWAQIVHLGESVWKNDGTIPVDVLYSYAPEVGEDNEPAYEELDVDAPLGGALE